MSETEPHTEPWISRVSWLDIPTAAHEGKHLSFVMIIFYDGLSSLKYSDCQNTCDSKSKNFSYHTTLSYTYTNILYLYESVKADGHDIVTLLWFLYCNCLFCYALAQNACKIPFQMATKYRKTKQKWSRCNVGNFSDFSCTHFEDDCLLGASQNKKG